MKKLALSALLAFGVNAYAASDVIENISCKGLKRAAVVGTMSQIYLNLRSVKMDKESGTIKSYSLTIVNTDAPVYELIPNVEAGSIEGKNITNVVYTGRKYVEHLKFSLVDQGSAAGNFVPDTANLIISPAYTVEKTIPQSNNWDKSVVSIVEVRKHSAVLDTQFNDHHGDYIALDCYSIGIYPGKEITSILTDFRISNASTERYSVR